MTGQDFTIGELGIKAIEWEKRYKGPPTLHGKQLKEARQRAHFWRKELVKALKLEKAKK